MQQLIASYLFQHKTCPLPGLGTLLIQPGNAQADFLHTRITAPEPTIVFNSNETAADALLDHIAASTNTSIYQAIDMLGQFANHLKTTIQSGAPAVLEGVGSFAAGSSGSILFEPAVVPAAFLPAVTAIRVIHPQAEHAILVGDKETTNTEMTEYFSDEPVQKSRWWIWAIVLGAIGLLALWLYTSGNGNLSRFGSSMSLQ